MATGMINDPYSLAEAFAPGTNIRPGSTVWLRGGTYTGNMIVAASGRANRPIIFRPYPGEQPVIDGQIIVSGSYLRFIGLEIKNSTPRDRSVSAGSVGFNVLGNHIEIINCIIHDHDQGITCSANANNHLYYGNLLYFNGYDSSLGHGTYPQNVPSNIKIFRRNFLFFNFGYNIHCWGTDGEVSSFLLDENVCFDAGVIRSAPQPNIIVARQAAHQDNVLVGNIAYQRVTAGSGGGISLGRTNNPSTGWRVFGNFIVSPRWGLTFSDAEIIRNDGNTVHGWLSGWNLETWPDNTVNNNSPATTIYPTSGQQIFLHPNEFDTNRAHLTVFNWSLANSISVDVSSVFANGKTIIVRNVQDYFVDTQALAVSNGQLEIDMQAANRSVASPVGWTAPTPTFPQFGAFVLEAAA